MTSFSPNTTKINEQRIEAYKYIEELEQKIEELSRIKSIYTRQKETIKRQKAEIYKLRALLRRAEGELAKRS